MKYRMMPLILLAGLCFTGCASSSSLAADHGASEAAVISTAEAEIDTSDMFTDRDMEIGYDEQNSIAITLDGDSAAAGSDTVQISGSTITITDEGTYLLSGTLDDGMIIIDAEETDKIQLVLNGVTIHSETSAAVYVLQADKVFLTTAAQTENTLSNGGTYVDLDENNIDAVIFSKSDLTFNGEGMLTIDAAAGHGIVSKDDLAVTSGSYYITAASHGLSGKDSVRIVNGTVTITAGKDGIHAENEDDASLGFVYLANGSFDITSEGDGISASSYLLIDGGTYTIVSGEGHENSTKITKTSDQAFAPRNFGEMPEERGPRPEDQNSKEDKQSDAKQDLAMPEAMNNRTPPEAGQTPEAMGVEGETDQTAASEDTTSAKGIKAETDLLIYDGTFDLDSADDCLHSNGNVTLYGGSFQMASGDDGVHADAAVQIYDGCQMDITQSYEGIEGLSIDITGGTISLVSRDDGFNAAGGADSSGVGGREDHFASEEGAFIRISGGIISIYADGDGIDSNGDFYVLGGETYVSGPTSGGDSAIDYTGSAAIEGGIFIATGSSQMAQNFGVSSTQGVMMVSCDGEAGSEVSLCDESGKEILSWQAEKEFSSIIISCPEITEGAAYTLTIGNTATTISMDGLVYGSGGRNEVRGGMGQERQRNKASEDA